MKRSNAKNNAKQPGGVTGKGFRPGQSGNPKGRPRTTGLIAALRAAVGETVPDGRTVEQCLVDKLVAQGLRGNQQAIAEIFDRLEGRPRQRVDLDINDITKQLEGRSAEELYFIASALLHYAEQGEWPTETN